MDCTQVVKKISQSIAKIFCFDSNNKILGTGSGFLYKKKGIIVTCDHVIEGAQGIIIKFSDSEQFYPAKIALRDQEHDLALLKLEDESRPVLPTGEGKVEEGMSVIFSGYPLTLDSLTTHQGILSSISEDAVGMTTYLIDGTVNSGNSGCPLMDKDGNVIGVVNAKRRERSDLLDKVEKMPAGALALHNIDIVEIYQALITNVQLGIGYAIPASYIPEHKEMNNPKKKEIAQKEISQKVVKNKKK